MRSWCILGTVLLALVLTQGCIAGYNSVFFATNSNIGFNYDTAPPSLEIDLSRYEGVVEPTFEGGETVPVLASLSSGSNAFSNFFWGVKSTFCTGQAAYTMGHLFADDTPATPPYYKKVTLSEMPTRTPSGRKINYVKPGEAKPLIFATDTTLGIKIKWSGQTGQFPSSANIGFKRKEGALAPIGVRENPNNKNCEVDVASLLATLDTDVATPSTSTDTTTTPITTTSSTNTPAKKSTTTIGDTNTETTTESSKTTTTTKTPATTTTLVTPGVTFKYIQYFATGCAANELARQKAVRLAMLNRTDPSVNMQQAAAEAQVKKAEEAKTQRETNWQYIDQIASQFKNGDDNKKNTILTKARDLGLVDMSVTKDNFLKALGEHSDAPPAITAKLKTLADFAK